MRKPTSPADALDAIRDGGNVLLLSANVRKPLLSASWQSAIEEALGAAQQVVDRLQHLCHAWNHLGLMANGAVVKAENIEIGMKTHEGFRVVEIQPCPCPLEGCQKRVALFDNGAEMMLIPGMEVLVARD